MHDLTFSTNLSEKFLILERNERELSEIRLKTYNGLRVKCPLYLSDFNQT